MSIYKTLVILIVILLATGCASHQSSSVQPPGKKLTNAQIRAAFLASRAQSKQVQSPVQK